MQITENSANSLCRKIVGQLKKWPALPAVLQVGGIESRASSRIILAIEAWLKEQKSDLLAIPEYRLSNAPRPPDETTDDRKVLAKDVERVQRIDYALVNPNSVGHASLMVDTVIEVKTNYRRQASVLRDRPKLACQQAAGYRRYAKAADWYVLYIVASFTGVAPIDRRRDAGWAYCQAPGGNADSGNPIAAEGASVVGSYRLTGIGETLGWPHTDAALWVGLLGEKRMPRGEAGR